MAWVSVSCAIAFPSTPSAHTPFSNCNLRHKLMFTLTQPSQTVIIVNKHSQQTHTAHSTSKHSQQTHSTNKHSTNTHTQLTAPQSDYVSAELANRLVLEILLVVLQQLELSLPFRVPETPCWQRADRWSRTPLEL